MRKAKVLYFEIEVNDVKELIKELKKHIEKDSTSVVFNLMCSQDNKVLYPNSYDVQDFKVEWGGTKAH